MLVRESVFIFLFSFCNHFHGNGTLYIKHKRPDIIVSEPWQMEGKGRGGGVSESENKES